MDLKASTRSDSSSPHHTAMFRHGSTWSQGSTPPRVATPDRTPSPHKLHAHHNVHHRHQALHIRGVSPNTLQNSDLKLPLVIPSLQDTFPRRQRPRSGSAGGRSQIDRASEMDSGGFSSPKSGSPTKRQTWTGRSSMSPLSEPDSKMPLAAWIYELGLIIKPIGQSSGMASASNTWPGLPTSQSNRGLAVGTDPISMVQGRSYSSIFAQLAESRKVKLDRPFVQQLEELNALGPLSLTEVGEHMKIWSLKLQDREARRRLIDLFPPRLFRKRRLVQDDPDDGKKGDGGGEEDANAAAAVTWHRPDPRKSAVRKPRVTTEDENPDGGAGQEDTNPDEDADAAARAAAEAAAQAAKEAADAAARAAAAGTGTGDGAVGEGEDDGPTMGERLFRVKKEPMPEDPGLLFPTEAQAAARRGRKGRHGEEEEGGDQLDQLIAQSRRKKKDFSGLHNLEQEFMKSLKEVWDLAPLEELEVHVDPYASRRSTQQGFVGGVSLEVLAALRAWRNGGSITGAALAVAGAALAAAEEEEARAAVRRRAEAATLALNQKPYSEAEDAKALHSTLTPRGEAALGGFLDPTGVMSLKESSNKRLQERYRKKLQARSTTTASHNTRKLWLGRVDACARLMGHLEALENFAEVAQPL